MAQIQEVFLFQPNQISNCAVWVDAYRINGTTTPANNTSVGTWVNLISGGSNFTQATGSRQPTFVANSINNRQPGIFFNSSNTAASIQYLFIGPNVQTTKDVSIFYVAQYIDVGGNQTQVDQRKDVGGNALRTLYAGTNQARDPAGILYTLNFTPTPSVPTLRVYKDTLNTINGYYNGTLVSNSNATYDQQAADNFGILMGAHFNSYNVDATAAATFSKYYMGEFLVYNRYVSLSEQQQVEGYLAWKWGLQGSLPSTHPFKTYRPLAQTPFPTTISPMPTITQGTAVFDPRSISGCQLWLDATDPIATGIPLANGTTLTQWRDKSSNGLVGTAINSPTVQTNVQNGLPVVRFNGTNQYINFGNVLNLGTNSLTLFITTKFAVNAGNQVGIVGKSSYRGNPGRWALVYDTVAGGPNGIGVDGFIEDTGQSLVGLAYNPNAAFTTFCYQNNRTTSNTIYYNGSLGNTITFTASANNLSNTDPLYVAAYPDGTASGPQAGMFLNGDICEVLVYFSNLSTAQRQQVEGYLAWKWGLTASLPNSHPYKRPPLAPFSYPITAVRGSLNQWIPTRISGSQLWLDASERSSLVLSGTTVSQWIDKSGNGRNTSATSGTSVWTANAINRLPAVYFNNTAFGGSFSYTGTQLHCFVVGTMANNGNFNRILSVGNASQNDFDVPQTMIPFCRGGTGTTDIRIVRNNAGISVSFGSYNTPFLAVSAAYANTIEVSVNGATPSPTASGTSAAFNTTTYGLGVNTGPVGEQTYVGYIGEVIIYNSYLSGIQRQQVEGYLAWKWGLQGSLPRTHPFKLFPPSP